jgi:glutathione synthase/RimK-type ligase-like ATP-grasp enzyme
VPGLLHQLALAAAGGIKIPRTIVTSDPFLATGLLPGSRVIIKALHSHFVEARPGLLTGVFPDLADLRQLEPAPARWQPPVVVQEFIEHEQELRVYYIHGEVIGFAVGKAQPADLWVRPEQVTAVLAAVPAAVAAATRSLATAMSIQYGAFDFLISEGEPVFLEVNLAGDWRWIESRTGTTPVTTAVAGMLRDLHLAADANARQAAGTGSPPLDLLAFLGGQPGSLTVDKDDRSL